MLPNKRTSSHLLNFLKEIPNSRKNCSIRRQRNSYRSSKAAKDLSFLLLLCRSIFPPLTTYVRLYSPRIKAGKVLTALQFFHRESAASFLKWYTHIVFRIGIRCSIETRNNHCVVTRFFLQVSFLYLQPFAIKCYLKWFGLLFWIKSVLC